MFFVTIVSLLRWEWVFFFRRLNILLDDPLFLAARRPYEEPIQRHDLGRMVFTCPSCSALHWLNEKLYNSTTCSPVFGLCCNSGKVVLPLLQEPPHILRDLLERNHRQGITTPTTTSPSICASFLAMITDASIYRLLMRLQWFYRV